ncbi:DUF1232 domain-containing protein [Candidatus Sumerlaeota bacterium]|nr:DUF1232 domain-containing protein [Candidatus Sumerlaeota bacterium]
MAAAVAFKREIAVYRLVARDPRTPRIAAILLGLAVAHAASPIDLIPDFIPVLGYLDDAIVIPLLVFLARRAIPRNVILDCRRKVEEETLSLTNPEVRATRTEKQVPTS